MNAALPPLQPWGPQRPSQLSVLQVCLSAKGVYWKHPLYDYVFIFCCYRSETGLHLTNTVRKLILKMIAHTLTRSSELSANKEGSPAWPCQCCSFQCYFGSRGGRVKLCSLKPYCLCTQLNSILTVKTLNSVEIIKVFICFFFLTS